MIWLGTDNGLYSYDGYHGYRHFQEHTFSNTRVNALGFEGRMLYLATGNGILKFDTEDYQYAETPAMKAFADEAKRKQLKELRVLDMKGGKTDFGGRCLCLALYSERFARRFACWSASRQQTDSAPCRRTAAGLCARL